MKSSKRKDAMKRRRATKAAHFRAAVARGDVAGKSTYARKVARKGSSGRIDPRWMWWFG